MLKSTEDNKKLFKRIVDKWGIELQALMFLEEAGEAIQAVSKVGRKRGSASVANVAEEFADLSLMMEQLIHCFGIEEAYESSYAMKLQRVKNRLDNKPDCFQNADAMPTDCAGCALFEECVHYFEVSRGS